MSCRKTTAMSSGHDPRPGHGHQEDRTSHRHRGGCDEKEVTPMQLSTLIDRQTTALSVGASIPCRDHHAELWFAERPEDVELAKALCGPCPARVGCLAGALERGEPWGVWGGQLLVQGVIVAHKRPRGRPRKNEIAA
jgi:WhiB family redox-sensing transcriptional regulator